MTDRRPFERPDQRLTSRPPFQHFMWSSSFTGGCIFQADAPLQRPTASRCSPLPARARHSPASPQFDPLGALDHRSTTSRRVLSYTPATDARLHAYPRPHRSIPTVSTPSAGIVRLLCRFSKLCRSGPKIENPSPSDASYYPPEASHEALPPSIAHPPTPCLLDQRYFASSVWFCVSVGASR